MFPPFDSELAQSFCNLAISLLTAGDLELRQISLESGERANQGIMLGALVCKTSSGTQEVLLSTSGLAKELFYGGRKSFTLKNQHFTIVPSIVSPLHITAALQQNDTRIHEITSTLEHFTSTKKNPARGQLTAQKNSMREHSFLSKQELETLAKERAVLCEQSLKKVFDLYEFSSFDGHKISLNEIIARKGKLPPAGTGDCCAPKLLSFCFEKGFTPLSMCEIYYGQDTKHKRGGQIYPPCDERCGFILPSILGLEILYRDNSVIVINKESGLLSVPGRTPDKQDCCVSRVKSLFTDCIEQPSVHRLDMETSGLLVLAFTKEAHKELNRQFAEGEVKKEYIAVLDGVLAKAQGDSSPLKLLQKGEKKITELPVSGRIALKFRLDINNRPHQIYDEEYGKLGITDWESLGTFTWENPLTKEKKVVTKVRFIPQTGRTHQLRLHSADSHGFGLPIVGDTLYGECKAGERLLLHSCLLEFTHPVTKERMSFTCPPSFI